MATCPPDALIASNPCLLELSQQGIRTVQFGAIKNWALVGSPTLDTGLNALLAANPCLLELSKQQIRTVIFSQLCNIASS